MQRATADQPSRPHVSRPYMIMFMGCIAHPEIDVACGDAEIKNGPMFHDHTSVVTWAASDF
jgi:hypothetical protein